MKKVGLFLYDVLMKDYPNTAEGWEEAEGDCEFATEETVIKHELKLFDEG